MGKTAFTQKNIGDKFYASDYSKIVTAINNIEDAINITPGTTNIKIIDNVIESIDGSKIKPTSNLNVKGVTADTITVNDKLSFGIAGGLLINNGSTDIFTIGPNNVLAKTTLNKTTFEINSGGNVYIDGTIKADVNSVINGIVNIDAGKVIQKLDIGSDNGDLYIDGVNKRIVAGSSSIDSSGIYIKAGSIDISSINYSLTIGTDGKTAIVNGSFSGTANLTSGKLGPVNYSSTGLNIGGSGPSTTGFSIDASGKLTSNGADLYNATVRGTLSNVSGSIDTISLTGSFSAANNDVQINATGLHFHRGDINLGNGGFVVDPTGKVTMSDVTMDGIANIRAGTFKNVTITGALNIGQDGVIKSRAGGTSYENMLIDGNGITFSNQTNPTVKIDKDGVKFWKNGIWVSAINNNGVLASSIIKADIIQSINDAGDGTTINGSRILVRSTNKNPNYEKILQEFFMDDDYKNATLINGGLIATNTIGAQAIVIDAFGNVDGVNRLRNSDFKSIVEGETVPQYWMFNNYGGVQFTRDTEEYLFGKGSARFTSSTGGSGSLLSKSPLMNYYGIPFNVVRDEDEEESGPKAPISQYYTISGYIKTQFTTGGNARLRLIVEYEDGTEHQYPLETVSQSRDWVYKDLNLPLVTTTETYLGSEYGSRHIALKNKFVVQERPITVKLNGSTYSNYTIDYDNGILSLSSKLNIGDRLEITYTYIVSKESRYMRTINISSIYNDSGQLVHPKYLILECNVSNLYGTVWFDGLQVERGMHCSAYMPSELTSTRIGPGTIETYHISTSGLNAEVIKTGTLEVFGDSLGNGLVITGQAGSWTLTKGVMTIVNGAMNFTTSQDASIKHGSLQINSDGIIGYKENSNPNAPAEAVYILNQNGLLIQGDGGIKVDATGGLVVSERGEIVYGDSRLVAINVEGINAKAITVNKITGDQIEAGTTLLTLVLLLKLLTLLKLHSSILTVLYKVLKKQSLYLMTTPLSVH
jgi:hypothetical protein